MTSRKPPPNGQADFFPDSTAQGRQTIHRSEHRGNFTTIANEGVNDKRLSLDTKGLLWWLLTKPNDWKIIWSVIAEIHSIGDTNGKRMRRMRCELQAAGYIQHKQAQSQKGGFAEVQYDLFEAPSEDRGDESHESHDDQSQPWITAGISRATWFRRNAGNPCAAETRTASAKRTRGETQYTAGISGNGEAGNPSATDSLTAGAKRTRVETQRAAGRVSHHDAGNPSATDSLTAGAFSAQRSKRTALNARLLNTERVLRTESNQEEGGFAPSPPTPPTPSGDSTGGKKKAERRAKAKTTPPRTTMPPGLALNEAMLSFATTRGMSAATADDEFQFFTNYHTAKATLSANWEANWRTWVLRHFKFKAEKAAERPPGRDPDWEGIV